MRLPKRALTLLATLAVVLSSGGCTGGSQGKPGGEVSEMTGPSTSGAPTATDSSEPNPEDVPEDDTDYSVDAGNEMEKYEYPDDPVPAEATIDTLCNLNREYLSGLRTIEDSAPIPDDRLRTALVGFSDLLEEWDILRAHFPEQEANFERAQEIYAAWDRAILSEENGDSQAAMTAMADAEKLLSELPASAEPECSK